MQVLTKSNRKKIRRKIKRISRAKKTSINIILFKIKLPQEELIVKLRNKIINEDRANAKSAFNKTSSESIKALNSNVL